MAEVDDPIPLLVGSGTPTPPSAPLPGQVSLGKKRPETVFGELAMSQETCRVDGGAVINGHMSHIHFQDFTVLEAGAVVRPPLRSTVNSAMAQCPATVSFGAFTVIGSETVCEAASVGKYVRMDRRCVVGRGATIADGVWLREGTWVPPEAVLAPFTVYEGCPAVSRGTMNSEACRLMQMEYVRTLLGANTPSDL